MKLFFTLLFFIFLKVSFATTYYISPKGNDEGGNGSVGNPWKTLYKATSVVTTPGSIIHVMAGEYLESLQSRLSVGVSIEGEGDNSILKSELSADWTEMLALFSETEGTNGNQHISYLKFDGQKLFTFLAIRITGRSNVEVHHLTIIDFKSNGIYFDGRTDNVAIAPKVYSTGNSFHDNIMHNCAAYNISTGEFGRGALNIGGQQGMLVYNNTITQTERPNGFNGWPIKYSLNGHNKGLKIYNNIITKLPFAGSFAGDKGWDFSVELWHCEGGLEIYGNTFQGGVDLLHVAKHDYSFGAWIHDNKISQPQVNSHYETGILFEKGVETAVVENNVIDKCSSGVEVFCEYFPNNIQGETDNPYNPVINLTIRNNQFTNIATTKGVGVHIVSGAKIVADMHDVFIYNNTITGDSRTKPYWGISIQEILKATNIQIHHNTIKDFTAACINIDPVSLIDTLLIEDNTFSGNGYYNKPSFNKGVPHNYSFKNNKSYNGVIFSIASIKMNIIRPLYYTLKSINPLEIIAVLAGIFCIWFCRKGNIYTYPMGLIYAGANIFLSLDDDDIGKIFINVGFIILGIYGWIMWNKRDKRKHRIVRITLSSSKERSFQFLFFAGTFLILLLCKTIFKKQFIAEEVTVGSLIFYATAFTALWLTTQKKLESWYWWIATFVLAIFIAFKTNFIFTSVYYFIFLLMTLWGAYKWKKRLSLKKIRIN